MNRLAKVVLIFLAFILTQQNTTAQIALSGTVKNTHLEPIRYVSVRIKKLNLITFTSSKPLSAARFIMLWANGEISKSGTTEIMSIFIW